MTNPPSTSGRASAILCGGPSLPLLTRVSTHSQRYPLTQPLTRCSQRKQTFTALPTRVQERVYNAVRLLSRPAARPALVSPPPVGDGLRQVFGARREVGLDVVLAAFIIRMS